MAQVHGRPRGGGGWTRLVDRWRLLGVGLWRLGWSAMAALAGGELAGAVGCFGQRFAALGGWLLGVGLWRLGWSAMAALTGAVGCFVKKGS
ncbi:hypothetical protein TIFTF001_053147 [Ficus carica]|uniref:Uncharacterized protein n=1 Tax=Ficus carica TaxID=3494 RepID=A0AA88EG61_FICCA|nr:hypothetical protein TIFTF001_053147 [Ficus carica]